MDWITGIQRALDYAEKHLGGEIDYEEVAKRAYSSSFHFQRMFSMLCGYTLGDYIRMRRLSLAAEELAGGGARVIDVALKYGYDSPESFSRAFSRFHGVTPSEARRGGGVKSFSRLSVKLILSGGKTMDYRIETRDALSVICKKKQCSQPGDELTQKAIPLFWSECAADGTIPALCEYIAADDPFGGLLGICFSSDLTEDGFPYGIGAAYNGKTPVREGLEVVALPAYTYAVFPCRGKMPEAFRETYERICTEFFPQSEYEYANGAEIEVYPSADTSDADYYCEIWIAVKRK